MGDGVMKRLWLIVGCLLLILLFATAGCYTVLKHPTGGDIVQEGAYYKSCADCHADAAYYHPYYHYGRSHYRWSGYYGYPWWHDDYWWWGHGDWDDGGEGPEIESGGRHLWGSGGWASGGWGFRKAPSSDDARKEPPEKESGEEEKSDEKKEKKTGERNLWKPRKKGF